MIDRVLAESMENSVIGDKPTPGVHPLHSHLLLYTQVSDSRQVLYTLECVKNVLKVKLMTFIHEFSEYESTNF